MARQTVDLSSHINQTVIRGHPADFPTGIRPISYVDLDGSPREIPNRMVVVREDTGETLAVVSDRYAFVPHQQLLDVMENAAASLDCGPVPKGIYVDRKGARMRAIFKFPGLSQELERGDEICPCVQVANTYDGTSRIHVSIGAFRFVCTNLAVGGGGIFAGGFMAVHAGEIPVDQVGDQLADYLGRFASVIEVYQSWMKMRLDPEKLLPALKGVAERHRRRIWEGVTTPSPSVFEAYNAATAYATHHTRSFRLAFTLLERINQGFQKAFPVQLN